MLGSIPITLISLGLGLTLLRLAMYDLRVLRLPDIYTLPLIGAGLLVNALRVAGLPIAAIWGAIIGYAVFWAIGTIYYHRLNREGLGLGDAKLFAVAGAWVGLDGLPYVLLISAAGALAFAILKRQSGSQPLPFGPWLAGAIWIVWLIEVA